MAFTPSADLLAIQTSDDNFELVKYGSGEITSSSLTKHDYERALRNREWDTLAQLITSGADYLHYIDSNPNTCAIGQAAYYHRNNLVRMIIRKHKENGEQSELFQSQCTHALWIVCNNNNSELVSVLLEAGAEIIETYHPHTAAESGAWRVLEEFKRYTPELELNKPDGDKNTPLYYASKNGYIHTINWLLCNGAEINFRNSMGDSALHVACQDAEEDAVHLLLKRGANINDTNDHGETPVLIAARIGKEGHILLLAGEKANLDQRDNLGNFPLRLACENGHTNVIKELITNGASFRITNEDWHTCMERAVENRRDASVAMCIRLYPSKNFMEEFRMNFRHPVVDLVKFKLNETMNALLDRMLVEASKDIDGTQVKGKVLTKYLEMDNRNRLPDEVGYESNETYLLQQISQQGSEDLAYHGTIRILVDRQMKKFGYAILAFKLFFFQMFLIALGYSLIQASYEKNSTHYLQLSEAHDIIRLIAEILVIAYFISNVITEGVEFFQVTILTYHHMKGKRQKRRQEKGRNQVIYSTSRWARLMRVVRSLNDVLFIRVLADYFRDNSNYWDVAGLISLVILVIFRAMYSPIQWFFAVLTFFINSMRLFKLILLLPILGPYSTIIYKVLKNDVPKFAALFFVTLCIFSCTFYISLFVPFTKEGWHNLSLNQESVHIEGITDQLYWVFVAGFRILVQGNVFEERYNNYLYNALNWMSAIIYVTFLFLTLIVYINVFIAQLSDTYAKFQERANYSFAWHRLNFVVQIQRTSFLSIFKSIRKLYYVESLTVEKDGLNEYFGVNDKKHLNVKSFNESVDVKGMLSSIQAQQIISEKLKSVIEDCPCAEDSVEKKIDTIDGEMGNLGQRFNLIEQKMDAVFGLLTKLAPVSPSSQASPDEI